MDSTLYLHALMASTSGLTSDRTSPVSGGVSLSVRFSGQRLTANHPSAASIAASGVRSPAMVIAMVPRSALAHRSRGANHVIPNRYPPSPETNRCEPSALESEEESCAACSRTWYGELATTWMLTRSSSACPLAGWLRYQGIRLEPPSIRASRYKDWTPNTAYARGVMITGHLKRPICQNGGVGPAPGAFTGTSINWQATSMRSVSPLLPWFHATQHPLSGNVPSSGLQPWSAEKTAEESPSMSRRQARAVSGWRSRESPHAARTAREQ
jgi:hypothetical protein